MVLTRREIRDATLAGRVVESMALAEQLPGCLTRREAKLLAVLPYLDVKGEILELGAFQGKCSIILAKSALAAGVDRTYACDPLLPLSSTLPVEARVSDVDLPQVLHQNLEAYGVADVVEFYRMKSSELARSWNRPLKCLWIDGDHRHSGISADVQLFSRFLVPGAVICVQGVLRKCGGPTRVFAEQVVMSESYGDCGICGSVGWAQYIGDDLVVQKQWEQKVALYRGLSRLVPYLVLSEKKIRENKVILQLLRSLVPRSKINPVTWLNDRNGIYRPDFGSRILPVRPVLSSDSRCAV
jgi:predicted O-methyltransferase YrrM